MIEFIKNAKACKLQNRHISSRCGPGHMTHFGESRSKILVIWVHNVKCAITPLRVVTSTSYSGANMRITPNVRH